MGVSRMPMTFTVTLQMTDREREQFLENLQNHSQKKVEKEDEIKIKQDAGEDLSVRVVWINGKEYLSTRDVVRHTTEKTGKLVAKTWMQVKGWMDGNNLETHKFRGSGEVVQDVIARTYARWLVLALTGDVAERNQKRMLAAIGGEHAGAEQGMKPAAACKMTEDELLDALDSMYPTWFERATGQPGAKRARRA
jgi:hypothetical protein